MAYERSGRNTQINAGGVIRYANQSKAAAIDLPSVKQYAAGNSSAGAVSVVGRPVVTHSALPAGAKPFAIAEPVPYQGGDVVAEFVAPVGYVMAEKK